MHSSSAGKTETASAGTPATSQSDGTRGGMIPRAAETADGDGSYGTSALLAGVAKGQGRQTCSTLSQNGGLVDTDKLDKITTLRDGGLGGIQGGGAGDVVEEGGDRQPFCSLNPPEDVYRTSLSRDDNFPTRAELHDAVNLGQVKQVINMVERYDMDLSGVDSDGKAAVHIAACHHHCHEVLKYLLESGASVGQRDKSGALPLHAAVSGRNPVGVRHLLQFGAEVDARDNNLATPLFVASQAISHQVIVELLAGGGNPALTSRERAQTPLHALIYAYTLESAQVAHKGKINRRSSMQSALLLSLTETAEAMVKVGAPLTIADKSGLTVLDAAAGCDHKLFHHLLLLCDLARADTILHAVRLGDASIVKRILGEGAVEARAVITDNGSSLLHLAAERGSLELVKLLLMGQWLRREGTLPLNIDARDSVGRTALFKASYFGHTDVAEGLLESGASPAIQDMTGTGVGYTFAETVSADLRTSMCEALQRWGRQNNEERRRAESFVSTKAPEGDVIYLSGVVPLVDNSRTKHLWGGSEKPPPPAPASSGEGIVSEGPGGHRGRNSGTGNPLAQSEMIAAPYRKMSAPTGYPTADFAGGTKNPWRGHDVVSGVQSAASQEHLDNNTNSVINSVSTEAPGEQELEGAYNCVRNRVNSSSTYGTEYMERHDRVISTTSQHSTGSAEANEEGPDVERNYREFSGGGKVRPRKAGGKGRRYRRHCNGATSEAHAEDATKTSVPSQKSKNVVGEQPAAEISPQHDDGSSPNCSPSASPRSRNWKLRPCAPPYQLSMMPGGGSGSVDGATTFGIESAAPPGKVTPEPPKSKPTGRTTKGCGDGRL